MVPQIDFLPASYHVQRQREHQTLWRRMMVFFFLALAVLGTWQQRQICRKLETRRDELQTKAEGLLEPVRAQSKLDQQLKEVETRVQLLATLELRVPMTRVLSAVTGSLPDMVSLNECQADVGLSEIIGTPSTAMTMPPVAANKDKQKTPPFEMDLNELRSANGRSAAMLTISGIAPDDLTISQYLVALRETKLFERVTLAFTGQHRVRDELWRNFQVKLQVKNPDIWLDRAPATERRVAIENGSRQKGVPSR